MARPPTVPFLTAESGLTHYFEHAVELDLLVARGVERLLIEDGIERNRGLAGLAVADDPLPRPMGMSASTTRPSSPLPTGTSTMASVRLTVWPSLISRSLPKITMPTLSVSRLSAMPRTPFSNSTISPACTLSSPYTRAMPSPTEDLSDLRDLRLAAEILDLLLEYRRDFGGADLHQETSFIACLIRLSLVRNELSTIRDPSLTTSPPRMDGSTW
jgi:hypothetical protein